MYSTSFFENLYLNTFVSHGRSASISIPTHKAGNALDNILLESVNIIDDVVVINDQLSDHYPILFNSSTSSSSSKSVLLANSYFPNSTKQTSSFIDFWSNFIFTDFPLSTTVHSFYFQLIFIHQTFRRKTKKMLE